MFGLTDILSNPAILRTAAKAAGIEAARLDVHPGTGDLVASVRIRGQVRQYQVPTGKVFTIEELLTLVYEGPPAHETPAIAAGPP